MKYAEDLAKDYDFQTESEYFDYIIESMVNGQRQQVKELFSNMHPSDQSRFLIDHLDVKIGIHKSTLNTCIKALCGE